MRAERATAAARAGIIRALRPADRAAVREICCRTAFRNMGSDRLFEDREVHADYWTSYYTDYRPEHSFVVEQDGEVVGYLLGCPDQSHFVRVMGSRIVPWCSLRTLWRLAAGQYRKPETRRYIRHMMLKGPREAPRVDYRRYPAHYHCNVVRKAYGRGYYTQLTLLFLDHLERLGVTGIHGHITEPAEKGIWQRFAAMCQTALADNADSFDEKPCTLFQAVLGDERPMVNRAWGVTTADYRRWIEWLRETQKL